MEGQHLAQVGSSHSINQSVQFHLPFLSSRLLTIVPALLASAAYCSEVITLHAYKALMALVPYGFFPFNFGPCLPRSV